MDAKFFTSIEDLEMETTMKIIEACNKTEAMYNDLKKKYEDAVDLMYENPTYNRTDYYNLTRDYEHDVQALNDELDRQIGELK